MRPWSDDIDPATIPDEVVQSERARRNALRRRTYTGGVFWKQHNPQTPRCRCVECMRSRQKTQSAAPVAKPVIEPGEKLPRRKPAAKQLLPIELGEHKTRRGLRALVVSVDLLAARGFVELLRQSQIYRQKKTWSPQTGRVIFSRGKSSSGFDLVARVEDRLTPKAAATWSAEHTQLLEYWEWAKD